MEETARMLVYQSSNKEHKYHYVFAGIIREFAMRFNALTIQIFKEGKEESKESIKIFLMELSSSLPDMFVYIAMHTSDVIPEDWKLRNKVINIFENWGSVKKLLPHGVVQKSWIQATIYFNFLDDTKSWAIIISYQPIMFGISCPRSSEHKTSGKPLHRLTYAVDRTVKKWYPLLCKIHDLQITKDIANEMQTNLVSLLLISLDERDIENSDDRIIIAKIKKYAIDLINNYSNIDFRVFSWKTTFLSTLMRIFKQNNQARLENGLKEYFTSDKLEGWLEKLYQNKFISQFMTAVKSFIDFGMKSDR